MINLDYLINHLLYQIIRYYFDYILKKLGEKIDNPSIRIYVNKIENRITFKIKTGYYIELLTAETMSYFYSESASDE